MASGSTQPGFDAYAADYDAALNQGLSVSGEGKDYFAGGRLAWVRRCLDRLGQTPRSILDFGCGTGSATPFFIEQWPDIQRIVGIDISASSLDVARKAHGSERVSFQLMKDYKPDGSVDLAFCNGVFHHIPLDQRAGAVQLIHDSLRPGGFFALWENNPWNPGTRLVMSRIPFDRDAIMVWPLQARRLLRAAGLQIVRTDCLFIFPKLLKWLRPAERALIKLPLGAQYQVMGRK